MRGRYRRIAFGVLALFSLWIGFEYGLLKTGLLGKSFLSTYTVNTFITYMDIKFGGLTKKNTVTGS